MDQLFTVNDEYKNMPTLENHLQAVVDVLRKKHKKLKFFLNYC